MRTLNTLPMANGLSRRQVLAVGVGAAAAVALPAARAQAWPSKPIRFLVPFAPGGTSEIVARSVAAELTRQLGQSVYVENKPGGAGVVAMAEAQKAPPDAAFPAGREPLPLAVQKEIFKGGTHRYEKKSRIPAAGRRHVPVPDPLRFCRRSRG